MAISIRLPFPFLGIIDGLTTTGLTFLFYERPMNEGAILFL